MQLIDSTNPPHFGDGLKEGIKDYLDNFQLWKLNYFLKLLECNYLLAVMSDKKGVVVKQVSLNDVKRHIFPANCMLIGNCLLPTDVEVHETKGSPRCMP